MTTIVMKVATSVIRAAIEGDLAWTGQAGSDMHIALTQPLRPHPSQLGWERIRATPEAWDALAAWCASSGAVGPGESQQARKLAEACLRTKERILVEMDRLANHPAYRDVAVIGVDATVLPARRIGDGRWWPTVRLAVAHSDGNEVKLEVGTLRPDIVRRGGRAFTRWSPHLEQPVEVHPAT